VYSLETTYNREAKTWHVHVHILASAKRALPGKSERTDLDGRTVQFFTAIKLRMEFDWLRCWSRKWGRSIRKNASEMARNGDLYDFVSWVRATRANALKEWRHGRNVPIAGLSSEEWQRRHSWNTENRRVVHLRPVDDRDKALKEALKYITKSSDFVDLPEVIEEFATAVRGARLIHCFGSWYGVKPDAMPEPGDLNEWGLPNELSSGGGHLRCTCGCNVWSRLGIFLRRDVQLDLFGTWRLRSSFDHNSPGTVPRPTIRALRDG